MYIISYLFLYNVIGPQQIHFITCSLFLLPFIAIGSSEMDVARTPVESTMDANLNSSAMPVSYYPHDHQSASMTEQHLV